MGFWSSLAGGISSLIPGVGPFIAPIVTGATAAIGGIVGAKSGNSSSDSSGLVDPTIMDAYTRSRNSPNQQAEKYYQGILGGDRQSLSEQLAPEVSTIMDQYDSALKSASTLNARGGGRSALIADEPFQKVGAYGKALAGARSGAADKLGALGETDATREANIGTSLLGAKTTDKRLQFDKQQATARGLGEIGSGLGGMFVDLLNKKKKPGASSSGGLDDVLNNPMIIKNITNGSEDGF